MQQISISVLFRALLISLMLVTANLSHAATLSPILINSQQFYQDHPEQLPLGEQFAETVAAAPVQVNKPPAETLRIVMQLVGPENSLKNQALLSTFKRRMRELRIDYRLDTYIAGDFLQRQSEPLQGYLKIAAMEPDYLVVTGVNIVQSRIVERFLLPAKPKVMVYDVAMPLRNWEHHPPLIYLGFDEVLAATQLANQVNRTLAVNDKVHALVLPSGYLEFTRCDTVLDRISNQRRTIKVIKTVKNDEQAAYQEALALLSNSPAEFVFSCSQAISDGVVRAIKELQLVGQTQTNSWRLAPQDVEHLRQGIVLGSYLFMQDDLAIGIAEAIKMDLEGGRMPRLYIANSQLVTMPLTDERLTALQKQAYRYSELLWRR